MVNSENEFVDNTLDLEEVPQIVLPFRDDVSQDLKDLLRALIINQSNIIANTSFLYDRVKELSSVLQRIAPQTDPSTPNTDPRLDPIPEDI